MFAEKFSPSGVIARLLIVTVGLLGVANRSTADELTDHAESLQTMPADAALYAAWLYSGDEIEDMLDTNAWQKLVSIPGVQLGWMQLQAQWQFPSDPRVQMVKDWVESEEGEEVLAVLSEMGSQEVYLYAGEGFTNVLKLAQKFSNEIDRLQIDTIEALIQGGELDEEGATLKMQRRLQEIIQQHAAELVTPDLVMGFRVDDRDRVVGLLDRYEPFFRGMLAIVAPELAERVERAATDESDLMSLTLVADQLPWDLIEQEWTAPIELLDAIRDALTNKQVALSTGLVGDFFVLAMSESVEDLQPTAAGELLKDRVEMQRLTAHADQQVRSLSYVSGEFLQSINNNEEQFREGVDLMNRLLATQDSIDAARREAITADVEELYQWILRYLPEPGAMSGISFATDRGYEMFTYNWGQVGANLDATQPLTLIDHVGSESLAWLVRRGKTSVAGYDEIAKLLGRFREHSEELAKPYVQLEEWQQYAEVRDELLPFIKRLSAATRNDLIPSLADGQSAFVFEATTADDAWCDYMPAAEIELPLPSLAMVFAVSDAEALKAAAGEYFAVAKELLAVAREKNPDDVPPFELPAPQTNEAATGRIYAYELPPAAGASERVAPNAGLSNDTLVLSLLPEVSDQLLSGSRPQLDGPAADFSRPLLSAWHFKWAKLLDLAKPWIDYGVKVGVEIAQQEGADQQAAQVAGMVGFVKPQLEQLLEVLKVWDSTTAITYRDGDVWVTHSESRIVDLDE